MTTPMLLTLLLLAADSPPATAAPAPEIEVPADLGEAPYRIPSRPGATSERWLGIVLSNDLPIYAGPTTNRTVTPSKPLAFGAHVHVLASHALPRRLLLARFDPRSDAFRGLIGWVEADWVLDDPTPQAVAKVRRGLRERCLPGSEMRALVDRQLPEGEDWERAGTTPLKAQSHPGLGHFAFFRPVPFDQFARLAESARPGEGVSIQKSAMYYVARVVVRGPDVFVVLATDSELVAYNPDDSAYDPSASRADSKLVGIVPLQNVVLVPSRTAVVQNNGRAAYAERRDREAPLALYDSPLQAAAAARGLGVDADGRKVAPFWAEEGLPAGLFPPPNSRRQLGYVVLGARDGVYHLAVPVRVGGGPADEVGRRLEQDREAILAGTLQMRTYELVFVIDSTGSMARVYPRVVAAARAYAIELERAERGRSDLEQIRLRTALVAYRDLCDGPKLVQDSGGYFDLFSQKGLEAFERRMAEAAADCGGGGDAAEQPFEGVRVAVEKYLRGAYHTPGAATSILLMGDQPNHGKDDPENAADIDSTYVRDHLLSTRDEQGELPDVMFNPVRIRHSADDDTTWDAQMDPLALATGGLSDRMDLFGDEEAKIPDRIKAHLGAVIEARRRRAAEEWERFSALFARADAPGGDLSSRRIIKRSEEIFPPHELKAMRERFSQTFFAYVYTPISMPSDAAPRWLPRVLLTKREVNRLAYVSRDLARLLKLELGKADESAPEDVYNELLARCLCLVMSEREPTREELARWRKMLPRDIEAEVSRMPIRFACLADIKGSIGRAEAFGLVDHLEDRATVLERLLTEDRFSTLVVGIGELHLAVEPDELP
jgi:hypothetical protein